MIPPEQRGQDSFGNTMPRSPGDSSQAMNATEAYSAMLMQPQEGWQLPDVSGANPVNSMGNAPQMGWDALSRMGQGATASAGSIVPPGFVGGNTPTTPYQGFAGQTQVASVPGNMLQLMGGMRA